MEKRRLYGCTPVFVQLAELGLVEDFGPSVTVRAHPVYWSVLPENMSIELTGISYVRML